MIRDIGNVRYAIRYMPYAMCDMRYAMCDMRYAICDTRYAIRDVRYAIRDTLNIEVQLGNFGQHCLTVLLDDPLANIVNRRIGCAFGEREGDKFG